MNDKSKDSGLNNSTIFLIFKLSPTDSTDSIILYAKSRLSGRNHNRTKKTDEYMSKVNYTSINTLF